MLFWVERFGKDVDVSTQRAEVDDRLKEKLGITRCRLNPNRAAKSAATDWCCPLPANLNAEQDMGDLRSIVLLGR